MNNLRANAIKKYFYRHFRRFAAFWIDYFVIMLFTIFLTVIIEAVYNVDYFEIILGLTYFVYFTTLTARTGQTLGKRIMYLKVVSIDNHTPIELSTAILRHLPLTMLFIFQGFLISGNESKSTLNVFGELIISFWMMGEILFFVIKDNGQTLHDYFARTKAIDLNTVKM